jgi:hypothetical protein
VVKQIRRSILAALRDLFNFLILILHIINFVLKI